MGAWRVWYGRRGTDPSVATVVGSGADRAMIESARRARRLIVAGLLACVGLIAFVLLIDATFTQRNEGTAALDARASRLEVELHRTNDRIYQMVAQAAEGTQRPWSGRTDWRGEYARAKSRLQDQLRAAPGHPEGSRADATVRLRHDELTVAAMAMLERNRHALMTAALGHADSALATLRTHEARTARVALDRLAADYMRAVSHHVADRLSAHAALRTALIVMATAIGLIVLSTILVIGLRRAEQGVSDASFALAKLATTCPLTGIPNRRAFEDVLAAHCQGRRPFALVTLDLDGFKPINDRHGHTTGDEVLRVVAERMRRFFGEGSDSGASVARLGGDEFAAFIRLDADGPGSDRARRALAVASDLRSVVTRNMVRGDVTLRIGASVGVACFPDHARQEDGQSSAEQMRHATSMALQHAKQRRGVICLYDREMDIERQAEDARRVEVSRAQAADEFTPFLQPVVDLATGRPVSFEMLARWRRGDRVLGPAMFLDAIGKAGLIDAFTLGLLDRLLPAMRTWPRPLPVSINLNSSQIEDEAFVAALCERVECEGLDGSRIEIEILEGNLFSDTPAAVRGLAALRSIGASVALDDFGVGYSNFARLGEMPLDKIKIDRAFVMGMDTNPTYRSVVRSVLDISRTLDVRVVAEGIESERVALELRGMGCRLGQGFHFARPMPLDSAAELLVARGGAKLSAVG